MESLYADDLVLMAETEELLVEKIQIWKKSMEEKGLIVSLGKTKVMKCEARFGPTLQKGIYVMYPECLGICEQNLGYESGGHGKIGENGTNDGQVNLHWCSLEG